MKELTPAAYVSIQGGKMLPIVDYAQSSKRPAQTESSDKTSQTPTQTEPTTTQNSAQSTFWENVWNYTFYYLWST